AAAALVSAALAAGQPWLVHWWRIFGWRDSFCGSADSGDDWPNVYPWVVWCVASAVALGALAGHRLTRGITLRVGLVLAPTCVAPGAAPPQPPLPAAPVPVLSQRFPCAGAGSRRG